LRGDSWAVLEQPGKAALALHESNQWIARRVEDIRLVDTSQVIRSVTLDIDCGIIRSLFADAGLQVPGTARIPLALLPKTLLLDFDIQDAEGSVLGLITSEQDSTAAQAAMLALLKRKSKLVEAFSQDILDNLYRLAIEHPTPEDVGRLVRRGRPPIWTLSPGSSDDQAVWRDLFAIPEFVELAATFTVGYSPMVDIPLDRDGYVLKYRHLERQIEAEDPSWRTRFALEPFTQLLDIPSIGRCRREHTRFEVPDGLFLDYMYPRADPERESSSEADSSLPQPPAPVLEGATIRGRITPERGVMYTRGYTPQRRPLVIVATLRPRVSGFVRTSQYTVFLSSLLLLLGAAAQFWESRLTRAGTSAEAAVALLLVVPTVMSAFLVRDDEHELLSFLLRWPRIAVASSAACALLAGGALAIHVSSWRLGVIWAVASGIGWLVFALLRGIARLSKVAMHDTAMLANETFSYEE
jgi:hypothetical protein